MKCINKILICLLGCLMVFGSVATPVNAEEVKAENFTGGFWIEDVQKHVRVGESMQLKIIFGFEEDEIYRDKVVWTSSDPSRLSVNQKGVVTGIKDDIYCVQITATIGKYTSTMPIGVDKALSETALITVKYVLNGEIVSPQKVNAVQTDFQFRVDKGVLETWQYDVYYGLALDDVDVLGPYLDKQCKTKLKSSYIINKDTTLYFLVKELNNKNNNSSSNSNKTDTTKKEPSSSSNKKNDTTSVSNNKVTETTDNKNTTNISDSTVNNNATTNNNTISNNEIKTDENTNVINNNELKDAHSSNIVPYIIGGIVLIAGSGTVIFLKKKNTSKKQVNKSEED